MYFYLTMPACLINLISYYVVSHKSDHAPKKNGCWVFLGLLPHLILSAISIFGSILVLVNRDTGNGSLLAFYAVMYLLFSLVASAYGIIIPIFLLSNIRMYHGYFIFLAIQAALPAIIFDIYEASLHLPR